MMITPITRNPHSIVLYYGGRVITRAREKCNKFSFWFFFFARLEFMKNPQNLEKPIFNPYNVCMFKTYIDRGLKV